MRVFGFIVALMCFWVSVGVAADHFGLPWLDFLRRAMSLSFLLFLGSIFWAAANEGDWEEFLFDVGSSLPPGLQTRFLRLYSLDYDEMQARRGFREGVASCIQEDVGECEGRQSTTPHQQHRPAEPREAYFAEVRLVHETADSKHCRVVVSGRIFDFEMSRRGERIYNYILTDIDYGTLTHDSHSAHRISDGTRHYVCTLTPIRTFDEARQWAAVWAQYTEHYLRTGVRLQA